MNSKAYEFRKPAPFFDEEKMESKKKNRKQKAEKFI